MSPRPLRERPGTAIRLVLGLLAARFIVAPVGPLVSAAGLFVLVVVSFPWTVARAVTIPAGWAWLSGALAWLADGRWDGDAAGGRIVGAALALLRRGARDAARALEPAALALMPVGPVGLTGAGLLAAAQGDRERARALLGGLALLPEGSVPAVAARLALRWLLADALARGAWADAARRARALPTRQARVLALLAARLAGDLAVTDADLRQAWMWGGGGRALQPLVDRALAHRPEAPAPAPPPVAPGDPLHDALARHARLLAGGGAVQADELVAAAAAWDAALPSAAERARGRAAALGLADAGGPVADLQAEVETDLAELTVAAGLVLPEGQGLLGEVHRRARARLLDDLEAACRALVARTQAGRNLPGVLEWTELAALRARHERAGLLGGLSLRRLIFPELHAAVCPLACRLWNERREHALAGSLFRWLLAEAEAVGDTRMAEHERRNVGVREP